MSSCYSLPIDAQESVIGSDRSISSLFVLLNFCCQSTNLQYYLTDNKKLIIN
ncbi:MAG: hypothetical protein ACFB4I_19330 [Cyanophyceae cyanobacterium]